ncbi:hypothetical protein Nepgr_007481 [Nepenthes gracilis]|uniref:Uncharacterized protein n=1 Tax=Nepenthes gracilis TaxID=150966 RepID=A0AAD3XIK0_NEPGR|nr:hypothetical protein Nepgr_007481 [Nepenthes gracilis]
MKHSRKSSCWKSGQNAAHGKTMLEFCPMGRKLENLHSRLVPLSSNRKKPKEFQQSSHRAAATVQSVSGSQPSLAGSLMTALDQVEKVVEDEDEFHDPTLNAFKMLLEANATQTYLDSLILEGRQTVNDFMEKCLLAETKEAFRMERLHGGKFTGMRLFAGLSWNPYRALLAVPVWIDLGHIASTRLLVCFGSEGRVAAHLFFKNEADCRFITIPWFGLKNFTSMRHHA